jgi:NhaP-type Na+/H+ or K+/H+ antiporter
MEPIEVVNYIFLIVSQIVRFLGLAVLGLAIGWLVLDLLKKLQDWPQVVVFLGLAGLLIGMVVYTGWGAFGGFAAGIGVAVLLWGLPKKKKKEEDDKK